MKPQNWKGTDPSAVSTRLKSMWFQTFLGIGLLAGLSVLGLALLGLNWSVGVIVIGLWTVLPLFGWWNSASLVKRLMRCQEPDPTNPQHMRLVRLVDGLMPKTGLNRKPPVYVSPLPMPNAFATGRNPANAFIAATEGLFEVGLTDDELEAILAHELAHVKNHDVAITSMTAVLGSLLSLILAQGIPGLFNSVFSSSKNNNLLDRLEGKVKREKKRFFAATGGVAGFIIMLMLFFVISTFAKFISLFVSRCRESHADALAALWTNNPCALSSALQKIVLWMTVNGLEIRMRMIMRGLTPVLFVSEFDDERSSRGVAGWWKRLGENHPPIPERLDMLDKMSGKHCPRVM